jgi:hypothetical protein
MNSLREGQTLDPTQVEALDAHEWFVSGDPLADDGGVIGADVRLRGVDLIAYRTLLAAAIRSGALPAPTVVRSGRSEATLRVGDNAGCVHIDLLFGTAEDGFIG